MCKTPEPLVGVNELQEYAVQMFVRCYIKSDDYWKALPSIQKDVKAALDREHILIAVTRQAAIVRTEPAVTGTTLREEKIPTSALFNPPLEGGSKSSASVSEEKISGRG